MHNIYMKLQDIIKVNTSLRNLKNIRMMGILRLFTRLKLFLNGGETKNKYKTKKYNNMLVLEEL